MSPDCAKRNFHRKRRISGLNACSAKSTLYYIYCREITPVDSTRVHVHCRCTHTNAILKAQWSSPCSVSTFRNIIKLRLKDQFIQKWHESISESRKCINYRIFKNHFKLEKYLVDLPDNLRKILTKFRCRNHRLPTERGCQENIPPDMRLCHYCREDIGDKYHYILICRHFKNERKNR